MALSVRGGYSSVEETSLLSDYIDILLDNMKTLTGRRMKEMRLAVFLVCFKCYIMWYAGKGYVN